MSIASLGVAIGYLLLIVVGAIGALLLLVWLFRDKPDGETTRRQTKKGAKPTKFGEESTPLTPAEIDPPEDRAA